MWLKSHCGRVGKIAGTVDSRGYQQIKIDGRLYLAHRLAWLYVYGQLPPRSVDIDHVDENRLNNAIGNLRLAKRSQNLANARKAKASNALGVRGVHRLKTGAYKAQIQVNGHKKSLGQFATLNEAKAAYEAAHAKAFGVFSPHFGEAA